MSEHMPYIAGATRANNRSATVLNHAALNSVRVSADDTLESAGGASPCRSDGEPECDADILAAQVRT